MTTASADRGDIAAEAAPKILGRVMVAVRHEETGRQVQWAASFGSLNVVLDPDCICEVFIDTDTWTACVGHRYVASGAQLGDAIAAIERELIAIRDAIPQKETDRG